MADDDVEIEDFSVTDWDLENEFNPNRTRYRQTREDRIYGIWAERAGPSAAGADDDDDDDGEAAGGGRPSFRGAPGGKSTNIAFVSSGSSLYNEKPQEDEDNQESVEFKKARKKPRSMAGPSGVFAGERSALGSSIGTWEKHTRGMGAKLLLQMGYQPGKGLGKNLQGISEPVEATVRKGKGAIGAYGPEKAAQRIAELEEGETKQKREANQWRKGEKKIKYIYKSLEEVQKESGVFVERQIGPKGKVIDMTGPEQRVLSGYHQIAQQHHRPEEDIGTKGPQGNFTLPELEDNLDVLIKACESDIKRSTRRIESEQDRITNLKFQQERVDLEREESEKVARTLSKLAASLAELEAGCGPQAIRRLSVGELCIKFRRLVDEFETEVNQFELLDLAPLIIFPLMKDFLSAWNPLENPRYGIEVFQQWQAILERPHRPRNAPDYYHNLMWEVWCPPVRHAIFRWSPRNPVSRLQEENRLVVLLETWKSLIPAGVLKHLYEQIILPKIQQEVDQWDPLQDTVPIHTWIHPWLPLMSDLLEPVYQPIRMKLAHALTKWHPSDSSAKAILEPWVGVMPKGSLEAFIATNIIPKLGVVLQNFVIDPRNQEFKSWEWFTDWADVAPAPALAAVLDKYFFPKFHPVLFQLLQTSRNYEDVSHWFSGWKAAFPDQLLQDVRIREQFRLALDTMNRAVSGQPFHAVRTPETFSAQVPSVQQQARERSVAALLAQSSKVTFKEGLEQRAYEKGILFAPIPNRKQDERQVYQLGNSILYLERNTIFVYNGKTWVPTSMESLLDSC
ncbi:tuftelin-interacting protein 11 [Galendromus occidentalis]|uniref:Tuftelin-interacting protein 11 n=1 Tax=Galendromus occidentalis TaxID=34638 RepID=A0AAJ6QRD7_9ACAR|nr:tuftelin-interacting protein 11 [Galendromus occidentalis]